MTEPVEREYQIWAKIEVRMPIKGIYARDAELTFDAKKAEVAERINRAVKGSKPIMPDWHIEFSVCAPDGRVIIDQNSGPYDSDVEGAVDMERHEAAAPLHDFMSKRPPDKEPDA